MAQRTKYGNWTVRWRDRAEDKMRARNFHRKVDAERFEAELKLGMKFNQQVACYLTFKDFSARWIKEYSEVHKSQSQQYCDKLYQDAYFIPRWGERQLRELTKKDLVALQAELVAEKRLSHKTINNITGTAKKMLQDAWDWELIPGNPWMGVKPLKLPQQPFQFWSFDEAERFLTFCKSRNYKLYEFVLFLLRTGLRKGEAEGLLRDSLDFDRKEVIVRRTYNTRTPTKLHEKTKSGRLRRVELASDVLELLKDRKLLAPNQRIFAHRELRDFKEMCKLAGVSVITFHDLRHTFASHLLMNGVNLVRVQELLGHSEIKMTMRYAHLSPGHFTGVTECLVRRPVRFEGPEEHKVLELKG